MQLENNLVQYYKDQVKNLKILHKTLVNANMIHDQFAVGSINSSIKAHKLVDLVQDIFDVDISEKNRGKTHVFARKAAAYILKKYTKLSLKEIAPLIGVLDHTTVIYNIKTASDMIDTEDWYKEKVELIEKEIENYGIFVSQF
jgi:chromosomal replication initiation ATPase DnaA